MKSKFVRCPCPNYLCCTDFFQILVCWLPWPHLVFFIYSIYLFIYFLKQKGIFLFSPSFSVSITWDRLKTKISRSYSSLKSLSIHFQFLVIFFLSSSQKYCFEFFLNFGFLIFKHFLGFFFSKCAVYIGYFWQLGLIQSCPYIRHYPAKRGRPYLLYVGVKPKQPW